MAAQELRASSAAENWSDYRGSPAPVSPIQTSSVSDPDRRRPPDHQVEPLAPLYSPVRTNGVMDAAQPGNVTHRLAAVGAPGASEEARCGRFLPLSLDEDIAGIFEREVEAAAQVRGCRPSCVERAVWLRAAGARAGRAGRAGGRAGQAAHGLC